MTRMSLAERRQKLIAAALDVIAEQGMAAATTRAIAATAGMPLASFHYAFESHQVLMVEAFNHLVAAERELAPVVAGTTRQEVMRSVLDGHVEALRTRGAEHRACAELADHLLRTTDQGEVVARWRRDRVATLTEALEALEADGVDLRAGAADLAELLVSLTDGLTQTLAFTGDVDALRRPVDLVLSLGA